MTTTTTTAGSAKSGHTYVHRTPNTPVMGPVQLTNTPVTRPPMQPEIGVGNPRMDCSPLFLHMKPSLYTCFLEHL
ncbi:hypothetical protein LA080_013139 [Diaporthe eres]|nr:hypothetical protein LA080_013139 [Diaporthe eres]